jgi:type IV secretion system protein TrbI
MNEDNTLRPDTNATSVPPSTNARSATGADGVTGARGSTDARELTDLHRTKVPADDPRLKLERPRFRTLRRGPALAAAAILAAVLGIALIVAITPSSPAADEAKRSAEANSNSAVTLPDILRDPPDVDSTSPRHLGPAAQQNLTNVPTPPLRDDMSSSSAGQGADVRRQARSEEFARARGASIFAAADDGAGPETAAPRAEPPSSGETGADRARTGSASPASDRAPSGDPNMQERKNDFLARDGVSSSEYLDKTITLPRSPYELKAGTVIPTVLITGINSDLPGQVVGQVRENVYDTVTGNYLLIPQGSRVIAAYDSMVAWGQERVLVCWNRVIRPDGSSLTLGCMPGVDLSGYAGFTDEVDNHWWRIITGAAFSSLLAATAQRSQGDVTTYQPSVSQAWAGNAAGQVNQAGQQITARNLQIQPTITVRPGFSVNVLVSKDIVIPPYHMQGASK